MASLTRRHALPLLFSAALPAAAQKSDSPIRLAISETVVGDVNLSDARAAMRIWVKWLAAELNIQVESKLFSTTPEIVERIRRGHLDAAAMNVLEYRPIADLLDASQIVNATGAEGLEQYLILVSRNSGIRRLGELKGRRLGVLRTPKMCVAPHWLTAILGEAGLGPTEQFFGPLTTASKFSNVVLPVFFGQLDACLTSRRGFETMAELNPQVGRDLQALATSPPMVVNFYIFCKSFPRTHRQNLIRAMSGIRNEVAGQQLATLFQFNQLTIRDEASLTSVLSVLDSADRARSRFAGAPKG